MQRNAKDYFLWGHTVNELCTMNIEEDFFTFLSLTLRNIAFFCSFKRNFSPFENPSVKLSPLLVFERHWAHKIVFSGHVTQHKLKNLIDDTQFKAKLVQNQTQPVQFSFEFGRSKFLHLSIEQLAVPTLGMEFLPRRYLAQ